MVCLTVAFASRFLKAADKIIVMSDGQIQKVGTSEEVFVEEDLPEKRLVEGGCHD
jgi:ABC-type protease/lipase transport system fused ATPase/permease subunit